MSTNDLIAEYVLSDVVNAASHSGTEHLIWVLLWRAVGQAMS